MRKARSAAVGISRSALILLLVAVAAGLGMYRFISGQAPSSVTVSEAGDIRIISKGEPLNLRDHLVPGKYTLFDYYADWCPPCRELTPRLEELARRHPQIALRKIDIVDWSHPVAGQQGVHDLPYLRLFGPDGRLIQEGDATLEDLERLFGFQAAPAAL
jgi:thiol-disulfide isomerase/thioredoxin